MEALAAITNYTLVMPKCPPECTCKRHVGPWLGKIREDRRGARNKVSDLKICRSCDEEKPRSEFSPTGAFTKSGRPVLRSVCKKCNSKRAGKWQSEHAERAAAAKRARNLLKNYGITVEQYEALLSEQGGVCAICGKDEPATHGRTGEKFSLSVDHCHDTGRVRGLLCQKCNRAIGLLGDDVDLLKKAIYYLEAGDRDQ